MNCRSLLLALALAVVCLALAMPSYAQTTWYVDDDAPNDPGPGNSAVSNPLRMAQPIIRLMRFRRGSMPPRTVIL